MDTLHRYKRIYHWLGQSAFKYVWPIAGQYSKVVVANPEHRSVYKNEIDTLVVPHFYCVAPLSGKVLSVFNRQFTSWLTIIRVQTLFPGEYYEMRFRSNLPHPVMVAENQVVAKGMPLFKSPWKYPDEWAEDTTGCHVHFLVARWREKTKRYPEGFNSLRIRFEPGVL